MKKRINLSLNECVILLIALGVGLFGAPGLARANLIDVGTATYLGRDYQLIYEDDQQLVWLDYRHPSSSTLDWSDQGDWVNGLGADLAVSIDAAYQDLFAATDWSADWRLPGAGDSPVIGLDAATASELGYLFYVSLGNTANGGFPLTYFDPGEFDNLFSNYDDSLYFNAFWTGTMYSPTMAWYFSTYGANLGYYDSTYKEWPAVAVHEVAPVPEPGTMFLFGIGGLLGMAGLGRKKDRSHSRETV
jgi:hypothetical protein